jgi:hypothetical protein
VIEWQQGRKVQVCFGFRFSFDRKTKREKRLLLLTSAVVVVFMTATNDAKDLFSI